MAKHIEHEVAYYYDFHPTEEDLMGETSVHATLVHYLIEVLTWLLQGQTCAVYENLNFYQTANPKEYPLAPDIAVIKGVNFQYVRSWRVGKSGPAPQVVFEIASEETWGSDLDIQRESTRNGQTHRKRNSLLLRFPPHRGGFDGGNLTSSQPDRFPGPGSQMALAGTAVRDL